MKRKCSDHQCPAPKGLCKKYLSPEFQKCEFWQPSTTVEVPANEEKDKSFSLPWQGSAMQPSDLQLIGARSCPIMFGMIGSADAGKTSFLCMLFRLLLNGWRFDKWLFAGSYT